ncbi:DUF1328 domain-containing protein [Mesorhizobium sp. YIM 152430]|jgi:uncharacterized membrane protein YtjA (UPF0391 family)|uniref:DUF1328 domain-containing protein n=1 Tax=Mesorhizobium sp. YIM 152430 TaxID=3031761 RepID=UPI0023DC7DC8|nr:DUF1328 domain-containing protein [Mesorhizobium sp. YIM 152430]MDF1600624.1 DUF1328 domain-containing protein [Mesorhizobium sp. YIM 152430]
MFGWFIFFVVVALIASAVGLRSVSRVASRIAFAIAALAIALFVILLLVFGWADSVRL